MSLLYFKALYPESKIICFEPSEKNFILLKKNIETNRLKNVIAYNKAVSSKEGTLNFYVNKENSLGLDSSIKSERVGKNWDEQKVESVLLSKFITEPIDFMKLDIEGAENQVLRELEKTGKLNFIKEMIIEYHHFVGNKDCLSGLLRIIENAQFKYVISTLQRRTFQKLDFQDIFIRAYRS